jgi:hypothetical protein
MPIKRDRRRAILGDQPPELLPGELKQITFGTPGRSAARCTYFDAPAEFAQCLGCRYNRGAHGSGILCAHRFGIDPTFVDGRLTRLDGDEIRPLE